MRSYQKNIEACLKGILLAKLGTIEVLKKNDGNGL